MKYLIRKVPERNTEYLEKLLPEAIIVNDVNHNGAFWSFLKALEIDDDIVHLEDDVLLCKDFKKRAEQYIKKYPNEVIVFSTQKTYLIKELEEGFYKGHIATFTMCIYLPKEIVKNFRRFMLYEGYKTLPRWEYCLKQNAYDTVLGMYLEKIVKKDIFVTNPSIAGHEGLESVVIKGRGKRLSPMFDYERCEKK